MLPGVGRCFSPPVTRENRRANDNSGRCVIVRADRAAEGGAGIIREIRRVLDAEVADTGADPDIDAVWATRPPGLLDLPLNGGGAGEATPHGAFRQQRNLARRGD